MGVESSFLPSPALGPFKENRVSYEIERQIWLDCGLVEIGKFHWPSALEDVLQTDDNTFAINLALSPRPSFTSVCGLSGPGRQEPEDLGRLVMLNPGHTFRLSAPAGKVRSLYCGINRLELEQLIGGPAVTASQSWKVPLEQGSRIIELLLNRIYEELCEERFASEFAVKTYIRALCLELARCFRPTEADKGTFHIGGLPPRRMRLLRERIYADAPAPRLPDLAELCGMTVRQLSRAFKTETNESLGKFVDRATMERARTLLVRTDRPVAEIAGALGYATSASFAYAFRRSTGMLPSEFRKRSLS